MALPCRACEQPVHDHAVICPHCGGLTGIVPDRTLNADEAGALVATHREPAPRSVDPDRVEAEAIAQLAESPVIATIVGAAAVVGAAVCAVADALRETQDKLPTAVAHVRRRHVTPMPSAEPERTEPPEDGEQPRFLK